MQKNNSLKNMQPSFFSHPVENVFHLIPINGFSIDYRTIKKLDKFDSTVHFHEYFEIEFVYDGCATHNYNGNFYPVKRGYFSLITPKDFHTYHIPQNQKLTLFNINFTNENISSELMSTLFELPYNLQGMVSEEVSYNLETLFTMLFKEFQHPSKNFHLLQRSLLESIILIALNNIENSTKINSSVPKAVNKLLFYIENNYLDSSLSLATTSYTLKMTQNYLGRIIKEHTGLSFNQYVNKKRLAHAKNILKYDGITIKDVSLHSGFSSSSYFIKLFKSEFGSTPAEFREAFSKETALTKTAPDQ